MADKLPKTPRPGPDSESEPGARAPRDEVTGSQTGTIGGGGAGAHNPSPERATGMDESTVGHGSDELIGEEVQD